VRNRFTAHRGPEIVATADGAIAVMDRLADKRVVLLYVNNGQVKGELALVGKDLEEGGSATGLFVDGKGVYVESEHSQVVRIGDAAGKRDTERPTLDGRPSRDGLTLLSVGIIDRATARFWARAVDRETGNTRFQREVALGVPFLAIVLLDSDRTGGIYVGAHVGSEVSPGTMVGEAVQVLCLSPEAEVRGVAVLPANTMPEERSPGREARRGRALRGGGRVGGRSLEMTVTVPDSPYRPAGRLALSTRLCGLESWRIGREAAPSSAAAKACSEVSAPPNSQGMNS
jgi:hypothetical protein